jgi:predicted PurR-regulated permease PerM
LSGRRVEPQGGQAMTNRDFYRRLLATFALAVGALLVWELADVLLLVFGAVLVAMVLRLIADPIARWTRLPDGAALVVSGLVVLAIVGGAMWLFQWQIGAEFADVLKRTTAGVKSVRASLQQSEFGRVILSHLGDTKVSLTSWMRDIIALSATTVTALILLVITAAYLTSQPRLYRAGLIQLFPTRLHGEIGRTLDNLGEALRLWLLGQFIQMALIGVLSLIAVWIIGLPSPLALGVIAGIAEFIPYVGPILAGIPAVLVALTVSFDTALWTVMAYLIIHQIEGNIVAPLISRTMVSIPPALLILVIASVEVLFGPLGILFAAPLSVVIFVAVKRLYVRDVLHERTEIPGDDDGGGSVR